MKQYIDLVNYVLSNGEYTDDRTKTGTLSVFGYQYRVNLSEGFPLLTTKKINFHSVVADLLWMLSGSTNIKDLNKDGVHIWDEWADPESGDLGPIYGKLWRSFPHHQQLTVVTDIDILEQAYIKEIKINPFDQIKEVLRKIVEFPNSRALVVSSWHPSSTPDEALSPQENVANDRQALASCQTLFQFKRYGDKLHLHLYQRSCDVALGLPFNMAEYSLFLHLVSHVLGLVPGEFIHSFGDLHIYTNHIAALKEQIKKPPLPLPRLCINADKESVFDYVIDDFEVCQYNHHKRIKFDVAV